MKESRAEKIAMVSMVFFVTLVLVGLSFLTTVILLKGICWGFGITFAMKPAFSIWLILIVIYGLENRGVTSDKSNRTK